MKLTGAYILHLYVPRKLAFRVGSLGEVVLSRGHYLYVGSACRGLAQRIARHQRLADQKSGKIHWHIDFLLAHPGIQLVETVPFPDGYECTLSQAIAQQNGVSAPIPRFGASDCKSGCPAHLYRLSKQNCQLPTDN